MRRMFSIKQLEELAKNTIENTPSLELKSINAEEITGDSIIENMSGYSAVMNNLEGTPIEIENIYCGAVKNGNKLTLVSAVYMTRTGTIASDVNYVSFTLPQDILDKLYPATLGAFTAGLAFIDAPAISGFNVASISQRVLLEKSLTGINVWLEIPTQINDLTLNTQYYFRFEATFLLSENLIG